MGAAEGARDWRETFARAFARPASPTQAAIWREVYGAEYPEGVEPYSYVSRTELRRFIAELGLSEGEVLVDVGCGRGGPGLWVAANVGARLVGIDIAEPALEAARARAASLGLDHQAEFRLGSFDAISLPDASANGVMSVDALLFAPDKEAAARELARVLKRGGRLVFTSWDYDRQPPHRPPQVDDHRPLLEEAGFDVLVYDETDRWRERQRRTLEGMLARVDALAADSGLERDELQRDLVEMGETFAAIRRRVFVAAARL